MIKQLFQVSVCTNISSDTTGQCFDFIDNLNGEICGFEFDSGEWSWTNQIVVKHKFEKKEEAEKLESEIKAFLSENFIDIGE